MKQFYVLDDGFLVRIPFEDRSLRYLGVRNQRLPVDFSFFINLEKKKKVMRYFCHDPSAIPSEVWGKNHNHK